MERIVINKLGPIDHCDIEIKDFMVFTGPQATGKSTISKSVFFFKNVKNLLLNVLDRKMFSPVENTESTSMTVKNRLLKEIRSCFLQTFGTTWCMDRNMSLVYYYREDVWLKISLTNSSVSPNYVWVETSKALADFLYDVDKMNLEELLSERAHGQLKQRIDALFHDDAEVIYIPAGRSMMTLLSSQIMFMYSIMSDDQKRSLDYCTQNYLERILQLKVSFSESAEDLLKLKLGTVDYVSDKENLLLCIKLMEKILHGNYKIVDGEERLQVATDRYVKINFASSGQQEAVWILNVLFYYLLNNQKSYFIIEEPESHLYPNAQKFITEFISLAKNNGNKVLLTTHSPYILGTINNLLYAGQISKCVDQKKLTKIIHPNKWLFIENLAAYHVQAGEPVSCLDVDFGAIDNLVIDGASDEINKDFERMVALQH